MNTLIVGIDPGQSAWKGALRLSKDKAASLDKARLLYPTADIPLLAHYGLTRRQSAVRGAP